MSHQVVVGLAVNERNEILMSLRRASSLRPHMWDLPGGTVEVGESHQTALSREWCEELGVSIFVGPLIASAHFEIDIAFEVFLYHVLILDGTPRPLASQNVDWYDLTVAVQKLPCVPSTYQFYKAIKYFLAGLSNSNTTWKNAR